MALRKPLVIGTDGRPQQIQAGDTLNAVVAENETQQWTNGDSGSHALGTVVYLSAADTVKKAQANASATRDAVALATATIATAAVGGYQTSGTLAGLSGLVAGTPYFLDPVTAGGYTATVPATAGQYLVELGIAISTTELLIRIRPPILL
jgi:hypothetical protein